jgi:hypothetical protein
MKRAAIVMTRLAQHFLNRLTELPSHLNAQQSKSQNGGKKYQRDPK